MRSLDVNDKDHLNHPKKSVPVSVVITDSQTTKTQKAHLDEFSDERYDAIQKKIVLTTNKNYFK